jgi:hypothetical protein
MTKRGFSGLPRRYAARNDGVGLFSGLPRRKAARNDEMGLNPPCFIPSFPK